MAAEVELDTLTVHEETSVGWCARTEANEIVDEDGRRLSAQERRPGHADPRSPTRRVYDDPEVVALRGAPAPTQRSSRTGDLRAI